VLQAAIAAGVFDQESLTSAPVGIFYDLDVFDSHLANLKLAFGEHIQHRLAIKSCSVTRLLQVAPPLESRTSGTLTGGADPSRGACGLLCSTRTCSMGWAWSARRSARSCTC
jgi:hypothetical protein